MSAYACEPGGSEPGVGLEWVTQIAKNHDVTVLTRPRSLNGISADAGSCALATARFVTCDLPPWMPRRTLESRFMQLHYLLWQVVSHRRARCLHAAEPFDVAHHLTFASDWTPSGLARIDGLPLVWGPVGGATRAPKALRQSLGSAGRRAEVIRAIATKVLGAVTRWHTARRASLILAQNPDTQRVMMDLASVELRPNAAIDRSQLPSRSPRSDRTAIFAGRLVPWKGASLAIAAIAEPAAASWALEIYGDGPDRARLEALAGELGVERRVSFLGKRPREDVLRAVASSDVFLFPSLHDSSPWAVAEAVAIGTPVVCLDHGGPGSLVGAGCGIAVPPRGNVPEALARAMEIAFDGCVHGDCRRWDAERVASDIDGIYMRAVAEATNAAGV